MFAYILSMNVRSAYPCVSFRILEIMTKRRSGVTLPVCVRVAPVQYTHSLAYLLSSFLADVQDIFGRSKVKRCLIRQKPVQLHYQPVSRRMKLSRRSYYRRRLRGIELRSLVPDKGSEPRCPVQDSVGLTCQPCLLPCQSVRQGNERSWA